MQFKIIKNVWVFTQLIKATKIELPFLNFDKKRVSKLVFFNFRAMKETEKFSYHWVAIETIFPYHGIEHKSSIQLGSIFLKMEFVNTIY